MDLDETNIDFREQFVALFVRHEAAFTPSCSRSFLIWPMPRT